MNMSLLQAMGASALVVLTVVAFGVLMWGAMWALTALFDWGGAVATLVVSGLLIFVALTLLLYST